MFEITHRHQQVRFSLAPLNFMLKRLLIIVLPCAKAKELISGTNFAQIIGFLFVDTILYYLLARYCDLIQRAEWGISYPWYYPFQKSFWRSLCRNRDHRDTNGNYDGYSSSGFSFSRVFKQFKRSKCCSFKGEYDLVIDNLSFDAPQDQITILLGHNGAGKSTVMKILSGIYDIDSGEVFVGGLSTETNLGLIRESLGLCPQLGISDHQTNLFSTYSVFVTTRKS